MGKVDDGPNDFVDFVKIRELYNDANCFDRTVELYRSEVSTQRLTG